MSVHSVRQSDPTGSAIEALARSPTTPKRNDARGSVGAPSARGTNTNTFQERVVSARFVPAAEPEPPASRPPPDLPQEILVEIGRFGVSWEMREVCFAWWKSTHLGFFTRCRAKSRSTARRCISPPSPETLLSFLSPNTLRYFSHFDDRNYLHNFIHTKKMVQIPPEFIDLIELDTSHLKGTLKYMPKLKNLKLHKSNVSFGQLPRLQKLVLDGCYDIKAIPSSVRELCLRRCYIALPPDIPKLEKLTLDYAACDAIPNRVRELYLSRCEGVVFPRRLPELEKLKLVLCDNVGAIPNGLRELSICRSNIAVLPRKMPKLEKLFLEECPNIDAIPSSVRELFLIGSSAALPRDMPRLEKLVLVSCRNVDSIPNSVRELILWDSLIIALPLEMPKLEKLVLKGCGNIDTIPNSARLRELNVEKLRKLKTVDVAGSREDAKFRFYNCESLETLSLSSVVELYVKESPNLTTLNVTESPFFRKLVLNNCPNAIVHAPEHLEIDGA